MRQSEAFPCSSLAACRPMPHEASLAAVAHVIQLAVAPVFLISGVAALLSVFTNRLIRIIEHARSLGKAETRSSAQIKEFLVLKRRVRLIHLSILLATTSALLISMVIVILFLGVFLTLNMAAIVGFLFVAAMIALIGSLVMFLKEVHLATLTLRLHPD
jgi:hypothetical protein